MSQTNRRRIGNTQHNLSSCSRTNGVWALAGIYTCTVYILALLCLSNPVYCTVTSKATAFISFLYYFGHFRDYIRIAFSFPTALDASVYFRNEIARNLMDTETLQIFINAGEYYRYCCI